MEAGEDIQELTAEILAQAQRKERKELQAKIQGMKHATSKGDKRKKKELAAEIALLESALDDKHQRELEDKTDNLKLYHPAHQNENGIGEDLDRVSSRERISKAQKRRDKKDKKEKEREQMIAEQEVANLTGARNLENEKIKAILKSKGLAVYEIPSDGDCMYKAIEHQLAQRGIETGDVQSLRKRTASYIRSHADDFLPFMVGSKSDNPMTPVEFESYCNEIESIGAWGGEPELKSLAHILEIPINVIQATGPNLVIGEYPTTPLVLSYHRSFYGLGEHYNSVVPFRQDEEDKDNF